MLRRGRMSIGVIAVIARFPWVLQQSSLVDTMCDDFAFLNKPTSR